MKQLFMLDTNSVRVLLERRSPQLDQWFAEERCSLSEMNLLIRAHVLALGRPQVSNDQAFAKVPGLQCVSVAS